MAFDKNLKEKKNNFPRCIQKNPNELSIHGGGGGGKKKKRIWKRIKFVSIIKKFKKKHFRVNIVVNIVY